MRDIWSFLLQTLTASGAAALLLAVKAMFRDKLSPRWQFAVWGVLGMVLLIPAGWNGRYVLVNWPFYVELLRSALTGEYGALAHVTAPVPLPPLNVPRSPAEWLFTLYCLGVVFLLLRYLISYVRLRLALKRGRPVEDGRVRAAAERYGLPVCPAVEVDGLPSAFICGVLQPVLALPAGEEIDEKVILHELLHLKYRDAAWGLVIGFFRCLHWCNPLLWACANLAGNDLESLCDQRVLERLEGEDRRDYGRILLDMADDKYARAPGTSSMANGGKNIRRRIEAIARFKRYPAGMGLVSACLILVLAAPLAVGAKAQPWGERTGLNAVDLARARTVPCTTFDGAFDTYAKAVLTQRPDHRAMCAPLSEQNRLAGTQPLGTWVWPKTSWKDMVDRNAGYEIYNVAKAGEDAYEGILAFTFTGSPNGETWSGLTHERWMAVQSLRAEKEGDRWVVIPQGELQAMQGDWRSMGNIALPYQVYEARWDDFTIRLFRQTTSHVDSFEQSGGGFFGTSSFRAVPQPGGEFYSEYQDELVAFYTGDPADRAGITVLGAACAPIWDGNKRPRLRVPGDRDSQGSSDVRHFAGRHTVEEQDWTDKEGIPLSGGGGAGLHTLEFPDGYALDFYLNNKKAAELTLRPVKGGLDLE